MTPEERTAAELADYDRRQRGEDGLARYGCWVGRPSGVRENPKRCIVGVHDSDGRWPVERQCSRRRGRGERGLFCAVHDPAARAARDAKRPPTRFEHELERIKEREELVAAADALRQLFHRFLLIGNAPPPAEASVALARYDAAREKVCL